RLDLRDDPDRWSLDDLCAEAGEALRERTGLGAGTRHRDGLPVERGALDPRKVLSKLRHGPDNRDRRRPHAFLLAALGGRLQRRGYRLLSRQGSLLDDSDRLLRRTAVPDQPFG